MMGYRQESPYLVDPPPQRQNFDTESELRASSLLIPTDIQMQVHHGQENEVEYDNRSEACYQSDVQQVIGNVRGFTPPPPPMVDEDLSPVYRGRPSFSDWIQQDEARTLERNDFNYVVTRDGSRPLLQERDKLTRIIRGRSLLSR